VFYVQQSLLWAVKRRLNKESKKEEIMEQPALAFVEELYGEKELETMVMQFKEKGYVILPDPSLPQAGNYWK
jgi:hypothetical protein